MIKAYLHMAVKNGEFLGVDVFSDLDPGYMNGVSWVRVAEAEAETFEEAMTLVRVVGVYKIVDSFSRMR